MSGMFWQGGQCGHSRVAQGTIVGHEVHVLWGPDHVWVFRPAFALREVGEYFEE